MGVRRARGQRTRTRCSQSCRHFRANSRLRSFGFHRAHQTLNGRLNAGNAADLVGVVEVRDVADLHIRAMVDPVAAGQRFLAVAGDVMSIHEVANVLRARFKEAASDIPTRVIPNRTLRLASFFDPSLRSIVPDLGRVRKSSNAKAMRILGWEPRSNEAAVIATAQSLIERGLLTPRKRAA
jgi:nucleoside-diphosphate-sugar epimerase